MLLQLLIFAGGLVALVAGAELLVRGASRLALSSGVSPLVVGLTIVAFGTSAPEMTVSVAAVLDGRTDMAIGNAVGSNTFNVLFILGLAAVITPLAVHVQVIRQELPIMIGAAVLMLVLGQDGAIGTLDGALLAACLVGYTVFLIVQSRAESAAAAAEYNDLPAPGGKTWIQLLHVTLGLALLVGGSQALVSAAVSFARALEVSEVVIGLTILAAGTSLPKVAASLAAALKGQRDLAVGNVVGSCTFNLLGVIGLAGLAAAPTGLPVPDAVLRFDAWVMLAALAACLPIFITGREVARWEGVVFLLYYAAYTAYLILQSQAHAALPVFSQAMMGFVIPLTVITLVVTMFPRGGRQSAG
ncbi:MAG: calcium/sodium antiporter [Burkholderiales bacterium]